MNNNELIHYDKTVRMRLDWLVAFIPALVWAIYLFGARVITVTLLSVAASILFDIVGKLIVHRKPAIDPEAIVFGVLCAFNLSVTASFLTIIIMALTLYVVRFINTKNPLFKLNAVLFARGLMTFIFTDMKFFPAPFTRPSPFALWFSVSELSEMSVSTPLAELAENKFTTSGIYDLFIGNSSGFIGEISVALLLIGGIYLLGRRRICWQIPVSFIAAVAIIALVFPQSDNILKFTLNSVFCGSTVLCAFFLAPYPGTIPLTPGGKLLFGLGCGIITMAVRFYLFAEGCVIAVLIMNIAAPYLDLPFIEKRLYNIPKVPKEKKRKGSQTEGGDEQ